MKNFALALLAPLLFVPFSPAETLDTVTFNPARLGQFERVKISDALNAPGGVKAQSVTVQSGGSVDVNNAGAYDISSTQVKGSANLPDTELYSPSVNAKGGSLAFEATDKTSQVNELTITPYLLKLKANALKMSSLKVTGEGGQTYGGESLTGLKLGGNEIKPGNNCKNLQWVKRTASDDNVYQVLAMGTCGDAQSCKPSYGAQQSSTQVGIKDTCPGNNRYASYTCPSDGSFTGTCIDVMNVYTDYSSQGAEVRTTAFEEDTCDGDRGQKFPGSPAFCPAPTCRDVFSFSYKASVTSESWHWYCTPEMSTSFPLENTGYSVTLFNQNVSVSDSTLKNMCTNYRNKWQGGNAFYIYLVARSKPVCSQDLFGTIYNETARVVKCEADVYYRDGVCTEDSTYREVNCCDK